jgi:hypothetical protein
MPITSGVTDVISQDYTGQDQAELDAQVMSGSLSATPGVVYSVTLEVLRNDLMDASELVDRIKVNGVEVGECNPDGDDYDCTFFSCPISHSITVPADGIVAFEFDFKGHSWDCDCNKTSWECSQENTVEGRTPVVSAVRVTLTAGIALIC